MDETLKTVSIFEAVWPKLPKEDAFESIWIRRDMRTIGFAHECGDFRIIFFVILSDQRAVQEALFILDSPKKIAVDRLAFERIAKILRSDEPPFLLDLDTLQKEIRSDGDNSSATCRRYVHRLLHEMRTSPNNYQERFKAMRGKTKPPRYFLAGPLIKLAEKVY